MPKFRAGAAILGCLSLAVIGAGSAQASSLASSHRSADLTRNPDCTLKVPHDPLSAKGLATAYVLASAGVMCSEADANTAAFVQATVLDPATGALKVYNPTVISAGETTVPAPVTLPPHAVVTIWTGFNGNTLKLVGPGHDQFVQFQQQSYAHSPQFFRALKAAGVVPPPLGMSMVDGMPCPSSRDFSIVDQDQSDNNPQVNQFGIANASDEKTLDKVDGILGCSPWTVPGGTSGPLQEAQAAAGQAAPVALIPGLDPFVLNHGRQSLGLQNLLRLQVDQPLTHNGNDTPAYCANLAAVGAPRLKLDAPFETGPPSIASLGDTFGHQLAERFLQTWGNLGCSGPSPIQTTTNEMGVAISATYP